MIELVVATRNRHKTREIEHILGPEFRVRDLGAHPEVSEIRESGTSFEQNAKLKALAASKQLPALVIGDDSGLEVDALGGAPGIYSARYAGANATEKDKIDKLLRELARVRATEDGRRARFRCVVALARNGNLLGTFEGIVEGRIVYEARGTPDLATTRFSFRKERSRLSVNCPPKGRTQSAIAPKRFERSPIGFDARVQRLRPGGGGAGAGGAGPV